MINVMCGFDTTNKEVGERPFNSVFVIVNTYTAICLKANILTKASRATGSMMPFGGIVT